MIVFQATDGTPIAALANFSMHYFSDKAISADYFGLFCDGLQQYVQTAASQIRNGWDHVPRLQWRRLATRLHDMEKR